MFQFARVDNEITAAELGKLLGCTRAYISQMAIAGRIIPKPRRVVLGSRYIYIFKRTATISPPKRKPGRPRKTLDNRKEPGAE